MGYFSSVEPSPPDPILGLTVAFHADPRANKVNLGAGIYRGEDLKTPIMACVKTAEEIFTRKEANKEYLPIAGDAAYLARVGELLFGKELWKRESNRMASFQGVGGTGSLRVGGAFLKKEIT